MSHSKETTHTHVHVYHQLKDHQLKETYIKQSKRDTTGQLGAHSALSELPVKQLTPSTSLHSAHDIHTAHLRSYIVLHVTAHAGEGSTSIQHVQCSILTQHT